MQLPDGKRLAELRQIFGASPPDRGCASGDVSFLLHEIERLTKELERLREIGEISKRDLLRSSDLRIDAEAARDEARAERDKLIEHRALMTAWQSSLAEYLGAPDGTTNAGLLDLAEKQRQWCADKVDELAEARAALSGIARQKLTSEMDDLERCDGDFEGAYDTMIGVARAAHHNWSLPQEDN